jgi:hypothetical protein
VTQPHDKVCEYKEITVHKEPHIVVQRRNSNEHRSFYALSILFASLLPPEIRTDREDGNKLEEKELFYIIELLAFLLCVPFKKLTNPNSAFEYSTK